MAEPILTAEPVNETYDIFLCTRNLPDALTPETAALRQLCSALIGEGYRVFFPPAALAEQTPEEKEARIVRALQTSKVMVAAAVGPEGAQDALARYLWGAFQTLAKEDPSRCFIPCLRDADELPEELQGREILDMGDLRFLVTLKEKIAAALAPARAEAEEASAEDVPEEAPVEEIPAEEEPSGEEAPPAGKKLRWEWLALAAAGVVILALILALCLK